MNVPAKHARPLCQGIKSCIVVLCMTLAAAIGAAAQEPTPDRISHADKEPQNWMTFYGNYAAWSYSRLDQINRKTVSELLPAWAFPTGAPTEVIPRWGLEAAPLVMDGILYLQGPQNSVFAVDAATGRPLWNYGYKLPAYNGTRGARGLAMGHGMIYEGTQDNHVVALDAKTGKEVWNTEVESVAECSCNISSPPIVVKNMVVTGVTGGDRAHRGYLSAFDATTGKLAWRFYTIPAPGDPGSETWKGDTWKLGGGSTWLTGSYDPDLNMIYWGIGNASSDFYGEDRPGSNLYTASLVALDADSGKLKWYFQETPHDLYDFDSQPEPVLIDATVNGAKRKLVVHSSKNGFVYVLDRETGQYLSSFPYLDEINWTKGLDKDGKPTGVRVPNADDNFLFCPGAGGGRSFNHSAYSPRTGLWYTTAFEICATFKPAKMEVKEGDQFMGGTMAEVKNPKIDPHISAFDPLTGKKVWTFETKYFNLSSLLATAGDLIFGGDLEGNAFALDARTGEKVWSFNTGGRIASPPVTYSVNGRQFIAISTGGGSVTETFVPRIWPESVGHLPQPASTLFVFALPEKKK
jgi:alcohol dehydrogenase (cytochrome c)